MLRFFSFLIFHRAETGFQYVCAANPHVTMTFGRKIPREKQFLLHPKLGFWRFAERKKKPETIIFKAGVSDQKIRNRTRNRYF